MRSPGRISTCIVIAVAASALAVEARAQNIFDFLFGGFQQRQAPPQPQPGAPSRRRFPETGYGGGQAFCVRLCDGRYFPLQPHPTASPSQLCSAFCPASQTRVFRGGDIQNAVGPDGGRYARNQERLSVPQDLGCGLYLQRQGCVGGLVTLDASNDPTLRPGDTVATPEGQATVKVAPPGGAPAAGGAPSVTARQPAPPPQRQY